MENSSELNQIDVKGFQKSFRTALLVLGKTDPTHYTVCKKSLKTFASKYFYAVELIWLHTYKNNMQLQKYFDPFVYHL